LGFAVNLRLDFCEPGKIFPLVRLNRISQQKKFATDETDT